MNIDKKTLADVQPGGMVRLGDQLPPLPKMEHIGRVVGMGPHDTWYEPVAYTAEQMRDYARAALSAQPSPGGQGDELAEAARRVISDIDSGDYHGEISEATYAALEAALAARQPVEFERAIPTRRRESAVELLLQLGFVWNNQRWEDRRQPVGEPVGYFDPDVLAHLTEGLIDPVGVLRRKPNGTSNVPVWLGPPAQAVDLGPSIPSELVPVVAALKRFNECAEDSGSEGCDIGRDWFDALTTMGLLKRTQRSPAVWTMTAEGERLLALIDSQAVGK